MAASTKDDDETYWPGVIILAGLAVSVTFAFVTHGAPPSEKRKAAIFSECSDIGFSPGSVEHMNCQLTLRAR